MSVRVVLAAAIAFVGIVSIAQIARAETDEERQACTDAAFKVCNDAIPDRDRVYKCLVKKVNQLNPTCQKAIRASMRTGSVQR
jgi:hypothetical protein